MRNRWFAMPLLMLAVPAAAQQASVNLAVATPLAGSWSYARATDGSEAVFRDSAGRPQLMLRCTRSLRRVSLSKPAAAAAPALNVWTSSTTRNVAAGFDPAVARLTVVLASNDPLLDGIAFSRGRFAVSVVGLPALVVPAWAEPVRVVEDCRA